MISCKQVAELLLSDQLAAQGWRKRAEVRLHFLVCRFCRRLARQIQQMRAAARQMRDGNDADGGLEDRLIDQLTRR